MKVYKGAADFSEHAPPELESTAGTVVTIGNFDGVHLGHQQLLRSIQEHAARIGGTALALTFRPHPHFVLRPEAAPHLLNTYEEKHELLLQYGAQVVVEEPFSREFSNITPSAFVNQLLVDKLKTKVLY